MAIVLQTFSVSYSVYSYSILCVRYMKYSYTSRLSHGTHVIEPDYNEFECQILSTCLYTKLYYLQPVYVTS